MSIDPSSLINQGQPWHFEINKVDIFPFENSLKGAPVFIIIILHNMYLGIMF